MSADTMFDPFEQRLRADLRAGLDPVAGPHPEYVGSPAAARIAADAGRTRRPWRTMRLLAVAALLGAGVVAAIAMSDRDQDTVAAGCPTLEDYAAASAEPSTPFDQAPDVSFPPVPPDAATPTGLQPIGTWIVVVDDEGPAYQIRVRDPVDCGRLPDIRSAAPDGRIVLVRADIQQLRPGGLGPWINMGDRIVQGYGTPPIGNEPGIGPVFGIPGFATGSTLRPRPDFAQSTLVAFDVPGTTARVGLYLADPNGGRLPLTGWLLRDGGDDFLPWVKTQGWIIPAEPVTGLIAVGQAATIADEPSGITATVQVSKVDEVPRYPRYAPPEGAVIVEALVRGAAWPRDADPMADPPTEVLPDTRWIATDERGAVLRNLGDDAAMTADGRVPWPYLPSDMTTLGYLAFEAPPAGSVRLTLQVRGVDVAWWMLRE